MKTQLLIIDPQNDFCDIPKDELPPNQTPALAVTGADSDMKRLANFIIDNSSKIWDIHVTLDSHNPVDIAHPSWWVNSNGENPKPFTVITLNDVKNGLWKSSNPELQQRSLEYVDELYKNSRYALVVWPEHCLIGHWGHNVHSSVASALDDWARRRLEVVNYVTKGSNPFTEHYSAVQAEVPDPKDKGTLLNSDLIDNLVTADQILIAGEALSHCVANTVRDIVTNFGVDNARKIVILKDCMSSVTGFEKQGDDFLQEMKSLGVTIVNSTDFVFSKNWQPSI